MHLAPSGSRAVLRPAIWHASRIARLVSMRELPPRLRLLRALGARPHRYRALRSVTMALTLAVLIAIPTLGLARFDVWGGHHRWLGQPTDGIHGLAAVAAGIGACYFVTFVLNAAFGRLFCGWGCPVGHASRLGDAVDLAVGSGKGRWRARARAIGFALLLAASLLLWWVSPRVLVEGSASAVGRTLAALAAATAAIHLHGRRWRWRFCKETCPIGVYYSAVQTKHAFGIHFDALSEMCQACDNCSAVCPVGLEPRDLTRPLEGLGGIALDGFPERNHCLTCGDCVQACELVFVRKGRDLAPLTLGRRPRR